LPSIELDLFSFPEVHCQQGLPRLRVRNHTVAQKTAHECAQFYACFACSPCNCRQAFHGETANLSGDKLKILLQAVKKRWEAAFQLNAICPFIQADQIALK
jgi:hypothetical protein